MGLPLIDYTQEHGFLDNYKQPPPMLEVVVGVPGMIDYE